ncbi:uncharacterized protein LOC131887016 [Tigriopus californicus]|uniref:uncharacterized protein LOC131887016 n=1 Tax=Tigriopus californicus TaxID=6832 RepID=UPI0027DA6A40|nr:uncharacterized protein LOC131887016 [Tigriopus californicus]
MQTRYAGPFNYGNLGDSPQTYYKQARRRTPSKIVGATKERSDYDKSISKNRFHANSSNEKTEQNSQTNPEEMPSTRKYQSLVLSNARGERLAVRDPAKEIFGYLQLRQDGHLTSPITEVDSKVHNPQQIVFGKESNGDNDYEDMQHFDEVAQNLGPSLKAKTLVFHPPTYGIVKYEEQRQPKSPFDKVRALVARNRAREHQSLLAEGLKNDRGSPPLIEDHSIFKNPFDLIRKKLQHMPAIQPEEAMKSIRRRRSKSRQQMVQRVLLADQSLQKKPREYYWSWQ